MDASKQVQHTPGPWEARIDPETWPNCDRPNPSHHVPIVFAPDGDGGFTVVCRMADYFPNHGTVWHDARLIASAPALLAACEFAADRLATLLDAEEATALDRECYNELRAAIAQSKGGAL